MTSWHLLRQIHVYGGPERPIVLQFATQHKKKNPLQILQHIDIGVSQMTKRRLKKEAEINSFSAVVQDAQHILHFYNGSLERQWKTVFNCCKEYYYAWCLESV